MAEPHANPGEARDETGSVPGPLEGAPRPVLNPEVAASDDAPTVISTQRPAVKPDAGFPATLRGRRLAHFELADLIGVGGMAAVVRARDKLLDRPVALKILLPEMAADPDVVRRFEQEGRAAAHLDHENVARVYHCGVDQGLYFIAFEFVEGENLRARLERAGRLTVAEAVGYALQAVAGLAHAASRGVVHRDVKPSNLIVGADGGLKLVDMGLARSLGPHGDQTLTQPGTTLGTFDYISPEQALDPRQADVRSDLYSLGCTFYHLLTGQAPVPEGTAARKLHHHQHVAPLDPRPLNPEIPDDIAAVLARMMAKSPEDRYQRAEDLLANLRRLASKYNVTEPDSVGSAKAVGKRLRLGPIVAAVAAASVLATLVVLHALTPPPAIRKVPARPGERLAEALQNARGSGGREEGPPAAPIRPVYTADSARRLGEVMARADSAADIYLTQDIDLAREERAVGSGRVPGLIFEGRDADGKDRELTVQARDGARPICIRLAYEPGLSEEQAWTALTLRGGRVTLRRLRFEVNATQSPRVEMAALRLQENGLLRLEDCEFIQIGAAGSDRGPVTVVVVEGQRGTGARPALRVSGCTFDGGQDAVAVAGPADVQAWNCAFGPHAALFHFRERSQDADLTLLNCSALLADGAAFAVEENVSCRMGVAHCLFSRPEGGDASGAGAALIRQTSRFPVDLQYAGHDNRYHNLDAFWQKSSLGEMEVVASTYDGFLRKIEANRGSDNKSRLLSASPWKDHDPLALLKKQEPRSAFQLDASQPELRQTIQGREGLVGVQRGLWGDLYDRLPPLPEKKAEATGIVVDPAAERMVPGQVYRTLGQAVPDARPGDVILIKKDGELPIEPLRLDGPSVDLTLRPYPDYHPVLTLGLTSDPDACLFRLSDGQLRLEQLEFALRPDKKEFRAQSVVTLAGVGRCSFKSCVATLDAEAAPQVPLAVVAMADPREVMRRGQAESAPRQAPEVAFDGCFVRGRGDLVEVRASRPLNLQAQNSLVALAGSFLSVEGSHDEPPPTPLLEVTLDHVTAYLTGHLVLLHTSRDLKDHVPVRVREASNCLFASADQKFLVHVEGEVSDQARMRDRFTWAGSHNAYSNIRGMLDRLRPADGPEGWAQAFGHGDARWLRKLHFAGSPKEASLTQTQPEAFRVAPQSEARDIQGYGADVAELPRPAPTTSGGTAAPAFGPR